MKIKTKDLTKRMGKRLREAREDRKLTQEQVCQAVDLLQGELSKLENGNFVRVNIIKLVDLINYYEINLNYVFDYKPF